MARAKAFHKEKRQCLFCFLSAAEEQAGERVVFQNEHFLVYCPFASRYAMEQWIVPRRHQPDFGQASAAELDSLAIALTEAVGPEPCGGRHPYNMVLHSSPTGAGGTQHWHIEVLPRVNILAGLRSAPGSSSTPSPPKRRTAPARRLR
jgi:UDPglucose--hexose-1-phosphate uridylyltransferase